MFDIPFFSICIPAYNAEKTITNAIFSLSKQKVSFDIEILVIDDGSKDKTSDVVSILSQSDARIKLYKQENHGTCYTRIRCFSLAKGKYVLFCDADDTFVDGSLVTMYQFLLEHPYDILFFGEKRIFQDGTAQEHLETIDLINHAKSPKEYIVNTMLVSHALNSVCYKAVKRDCFPINMDFSPYFKLKNSEDRLISYLCTKCATNIGCLRECLYNYYMNPASVTHVANPKRYVDYFLAEQVILSDLHECKMDDIETLTLYANGSIRQLIIFSIIEILRSNAPWKVKYADLLGVRKSNVIDELYTLINTKGLSLKHKLVIISFNLLTIGR